MQTCPKPSQGSVFYSRNSHESLTLAERHFRVASMRSGASARCSYRAWPTQKAATRPEINLVVRKNSAAHGGLSFDNLLAQLGELRPVAKNGIGAWSIANSCWVDAYFGKPKLAAIREEGTPPNVKLMGYSQVVRARFGSLARGINALQCPPNRQGLGPRLNRSSPVASGHARTQVRIPSSRQVPRPFAWSQACATVEFEPRLCAARGIDSI